MLAGPALLYIGVFDQIYRSLFSIPLLTNIEHRRSLFIPLGCQ